MPTCVRVCLSACAAAPASARAGRGGAARGWRRGTGFGARPPSPPPPPRSARCRSLLLRFPSRAPPTPNPPPQNQISRGRLWQLCVSPASCRRRAGKRRAASARERRVCPPPLSPPPPARFVLLFLHSLSTRASPFQLTHPLGRPPSAMAPACACVCVYGLAPEVGPGRGRGAAGRGTGSVSAHSRQDGDGATQTGPHPGARASGQGGRGARPPCACVCGGPCWGRGQARFGACGTRGGCEGGRASERRARARGERERPLTPLSRCLSVPPPHPVPQTHNQALSPPQVRSQCVCVPACRQFDRRARGGRPGRPRMQA